MQCNVSVCLEDLPTISSIMSTSQNNSNNISTSGGPPLKPWEVARMEATNSNPVEVSPKPYYQYSTNQEEEQKQQTQMVPPSHPSHSRYGSGYTTQYSSNNQYGMSNSYYGYPSSYNTNSMYGSYTGFGNGNFYGAGNGSFGYNRSSPWSFQQPIYPGMPPPGGDISKPPVWQRFLDGLHKVVSAFGRVSFLVDENTQAFHFFITALLALLDKAGSLYGELARYIMKLLGFGRRQSNKALITQLSNKTSTTPFQKEQMSSQSGNGTDS